MLILFFFLFYSLIAIYVITPKNTTQLWLITILVPLSMVILYTFLVYYAITIGITNSTNISSAYIAGGAMVKTLVPAIIVGFVIYFQLKKKLANEGKVKFPVILVVVTGIALIMSIFMAFLKHKAESSTVNLNYLYETYQDSQKTMNNIQNIEIYPDSIKEITISNNYSVKIPYFVSEMKGKMNAFASLEYANEVREFYVVVMNEEKSEVLIDAFSELGYSENLSGYANYIIDLTKKNFNKLNELYKIDTTLNNNHAIIYKFSAKTISNDIDCYYNMAIIEGRDNFYTMSIWTTESKKSMYDKIMKKVIYSFKEL